MAKDEDIAFATAVNEYGFYFVPQDYLGREVPDALLAGEVYEPKTIRLIQRLAGHGDVVTGGAFVGDFLPALSGALAGGALLHSFEPNPLSLLACRKTIAANRLHNVRLHPVAVGEAAGHLPLQLSSSAGTPMAARAKIATTAVKGETVDVPVARLDDLIGADRRVSVLHLDIEGHEWPALLGARRIIEADSPVIILEAAKRWVRRDYETRLRDSFPACRYLCAGVMERNAFFLPFDGDRG